MSFVIRQFDHAKPLGPTLQDLRKAAHLTLSDMERKTKIRRPYLIALETGDYDALPEPLYTKKFLRTYVQCVGGNETYFLERFEHERGTCDFVGKALLPRRRARRGQFFVPSRLAKFFGLLLVGIGLFAYLGSQVNAIISAPQVIVTQPQDGFTTSQATLFVEGSVEQAASVKINGSDVVLTTQNTFKEEVALKRGLNIIQIDAKKRYSRTQTLYRRVVLEQQTQPLGITPSP